MNNNKPYKLENINMLPGDRNGSPDDCFIYFFSLNKKPWVNRCVSICKIRSVTCEVLTLSKINKINKVKTELMEPRFRAIPF